MEILAVFELLGAFARGCDDARHWMRTLFTNLARDADAVVSADHGWQPTCGGGRAGYGFGLVASDGGVAVQL